MIGELLSPKGESSGSFQQLALNSVFERFTSRRAKNALTGLAVGTWAYRKLQEMNHRAVANSKFYVTVGDDDEIYRAVRLWLQNHVPDERQQRLQVSTRRARSDGDVGDIYLSEPASSRRRKRGQSFFGQMDVFVADGFFHVLDIDGEKVEVSLRNPDDNALPSGSNKDDEPEGRFRRVGPWFVIEFACHSEKGRDAVLRLLQTITDQEYTENTTPNLYVASRYGSFDRYREAPIRSLDTVVLAKGKKEELLDDLQEFFDRRPRYEKLGWPYHRGYLLYGPPGTGKTSVARGIADHFGLDLYYIPLADMKADTSLINLLGGIDAGSILLLEDIDVLHAATSREDVENLMSLSGLLNVLDGAVTPHGLVYFMTTNHLETLDDALLRPGRADVQMEVGYLDDDQLVRLFEMFYGVSPILPSLLDLEIAPAEVTEIFKHHFDDVNGAVRELREYLDALRPLVHAISSHPSSNTRIRLMNNEVES